MTIYSGIEDIIVDNDVKFNPDSENTYIINDYRFQFKLQNNILKIKVLQLKSIVSYNCVFSNDKLKNYTNTKTFSSLVMIYNMLIDCFKKTNDKTLSMTIKHENNDITLDLCYSSKNLTRTITLIIEREEIDQVEVILKNKFQSLSNRVANLEMIINNTMKEFEKVKDYDLVQFYDTNVVRYVIVGIDFMDDVIKKPFNYGEVYNIIIYNCNRENCDGDHSIKYNINYGAKCNNYPGKYNNAYHTIIESKNRLLWVSRTIFPLDKLTTIIHKFYNLEIFIIEEGIVKGYDNSLLYQIQRVPSIKNLKLSYFENSDVKTSNIINIDHDNIATFIK